MAGKDSDSIYFYQSEQSGDKVFDVRDETDKRTAQRHNPDAPNESKDAKLAVSQDQKRNDVVGKGTDGNELKDHQKSSSEEKSFRRKPGTDGAKKETPSDTDKGMEKNTEEEQTPESKISRAMRFLMGQDSKRKSGEKDAKKSLEDEKSESEHRKNSSLPPIPGPGVDDGRKHKKPSEDNHEGEQDSSGPKEAKPSKSMEETNTQGPLKEQKGKNRKTPGFKWVVEPNRVFSDSKRDNENMSTESQKNSPRKDSRDRHVKQEMKSLDDPPPSKWRFGRKPRNEGSGGKSESAYAVGSPAVSGDDFNIESEASSQPDMGQFYQRKLSESRRRFSGKTHELERRRKRSIENDAKDLTDKQVQTQADPMLLGLYGDPFDDLAFDGRTVPQVKPENPDPRDANVRDEFQGTSPGSELHDRYAGNEGKIDVEQPRRRSIPEKEKETDSYDAKDRKMMEALHGFFVYLTFLITVSVIVFSMTSRSAFYFTNAVEAGFMDKVYVPLAVLPNESTQAEATPTATPPVTTTKKPKLRAQSADGPGQTFSPMNASQEGGGRRMGRMAPWQSLRIGEDERTKPTYTPAGVSLRHAVTVEDYWNFLNHTFINFLYSEFLISEKNPLQHTEDDDRPIFYSSRLLGVPRIRQLRVTPTSCTIHSQVEHLFRQCFGYYNARTESREELHWEKAVETIETAWVYTGADRMSSVRYTGTFGTYGGGGYRMDLSLNSNTTAAIINELEDNRWINQGTRAVILDFTIYNSNVNLFLVCKIVIEIPPTGGIYPTGHFNALKLLRYVSVQDMIVLGFEHVFILFVACNTLLIIAQMFRTGLTYFTNGWNILDLLILALSYAAIVMALYRYFIVETMVHELTRKTTEHPPFDFPCVVQTNFDQLCGVLLFFVWIRMFKYLSFIRNISVFYRTLARSAKSIASFGVMFLVVFLAFVQWAYLIFGSEVEEYRTVWSAAMALLQTVIGRFDYKQLEASNYLLAPVFVISYVFFCFFIMINIFGAIIFESYRITKSQLYVHHDPSALRYLKTAVTNILTLGRKRKTVSENKSELATTGQNIFDALKRAGYTQAEVDIFFARYEIKIDQIFTKSQVKELLIRLEERSFENEPYEVTSGAFTDLSNEVQKLQKIVQAYHEDAEQMKKQISNLTRS